MNTVIFACVHNAGRSQMARAFFEKYANPEKARAVSAGTEPAKQVHAVVLEAMREVGIDLAGVTPQKLTAELAAGASHLVTMGCGESCPFIPGVQILDWPLPDPKGQDMSAVRETRGRVETLVQEFLQQNGWLRRGA